MTEQTDAAEVEALARVWYESDQQFLYGHSGRWAEDRSERESYTQAVERIWPTIAAREAAAEARGAQAVLDDVERRIRHQASVAQVGSMEWRAHFADLAHIEAARAAAAAAGGGGEGVASGLCDNRGPRIGEDCPRCRRPLNHTGVHQNAIEDGFGSVVSW